MHFTMHPEKVSNIVKPGVMMSGQGSGVRVSRVRAGSWKTSEANGTSKAMKQFLQRLQ